MNSKKWFTIIELLVWIVVFLLWLLSAYLLIFSSLSASSKSRDEIIVANLAREKLELLRNIRDTNWIQYLKWNKLDNWWMVWLTLTWWYYRIENNLSDTDPNKISIYKLSSSFNENDPQWAWPWDNVRLCTDSRWIYTYDCTTNKPSHFYTFLKVEPLVTEDASWNAIPVDDAYKVNAISVIWNKSKSRYVISTIITDWKK